MSNDGEIFAFIFDSGAVNSPSYDQVIFEKMICGKEFIENPHKIIVSLGDMIIPEKLFDIDIEPYVYKDEYCTIDFNKMRNYKFKDWCKCQFKYVKKIQNKNVHFIHLPFGKNL